MIKKINKKMIQQLNNTQRKAILITFQNNQSLGVKITFPYNPRDVSRIKSLEGRIFHNKGKEKYWTAPLNKDTYNKLIAWGFSLSTELEEWGKKIGQTIDIIEDIDIPGLKMELYPFQKIGVAFLEKNNGRALIADSMGLGKTAQALAWLQLHPEKRPAIIVVPASLKLNWMREAERWMNDPKVQIISGMKINIPIYGKIIIINYDILVAWAGKLQAIQPKVIIADEIHYIKSTKAKRTKAFKAISKKVPHVLGLSGTPIINRPVEAFNAINIIQPNLFPSFWKYAMRYCGAKHNGFGWDFNGATNTQELHKKLTRNIMIRRKKEDVLKDLPTKTISVVPLELSNEKEYRYAEKNFISWLQDINPDKVKKVQNAEALAKIEALKQLVVKGKIDMVINWIRDFLASDEKLVVFCTHKWTINQLMKQFNDIAVKVDGSVTGENRDKAVQAFQNDFSVKLFVGNIKAAGVGLTLTAASSAAIIELPWTPGDAEQAEDRIHRIGQKANAVNIYYLICKNTIEEDIINMLDKKRKVLDQILDGKKTKNNSLLSDLLDKYR